MEGRERENGGMEREGKKEGRGREGKEVVMMVIGQIKKFKGVSKLKKFTVPL